MPNKEAESSRRKSSAQEPSFVCAWICTKEVVRPRLFGLGLKKWPSRRARTLANTLDVRTTSPSSPDDLARSKVEVVRGTCADDVPAEAKVVEAPLPQAQHFFSSFLSFFFLDTTRTATNVIESLVCQRRERVRCRSRVGSRASVLGPHFTAKIGPT